MGLEALTAANQVPDEPDKPNELETPVIAIDFNDRGGEERIFQRLKPGEAGRALHNGKEVFVKRSEYGGASEVLILRSGSLEQGGHWQTWEIVRDDLRHKSSVGQESNSNLVGLQKDFRTIVAEIQRRPKTKGNSKPSMEVDPQATLVKLIAVHILNNIGNLGIKIRSDQLGSVIIAINGKLNVPMMDFFSVFHKLVNRVQAQEGWSQSPSLKSTQNEFEGMYNGISSHVADMLVKELDPASVRKNPPSRGYLNVHAGYNHQRDEFSGFDIYYST